METSWTEDGGAPALVPDRVRTLDDVTALHDELLAAFADADSVVCDLTSTACEVDPADLAGAVAGVASRVAEWPGAVLTVVALDDVREQLLLQPHPASLVVLARRPASGERRPHAAVRACRQVLEPVLRAPALARAFLRETLEGWPAGGYRDDALVVVDELVANAVLHAGTEIELRFALQPDRLGIAVADRSPGKPGVGRPGAGAESGRGLMLVDALARSWHVLPRRHGGKVVRAVLAAVPRPPGAPSAPGGGPAARGAGA